eukprot:EG_transcript_9419
MSHLVHPAARLAEGEAEPEEEPLPPEIEFPDTTMVCSLGCHPTMPLLAAGLMDGSVHFYRYAIGESTCTHSVRLHKDSCRDLAFAPSGRSVVSVAANRTVRAYDVQAQRVTLDSRKSAHRSPVNRVAFYKEHGFLTGDDAGIILLWDARAAKPTAIIDDDADQITSFALDPEGLYCYATSLDGCVTIIDLRTRKKDPVETVIGPMKTEMTSAAVLEGGDHIAVGTSKGDVLMWRWGKWLSASANVRGHPTEVQCMLPAGPQHVLTGGADGVIRHIRLLPEGERSFDRVVAVHQETGLDVLVDFGVEIMQYTHDRAWLAYSTHDYCIHWADVSNLDALPAANSEGEGEAEGQDHGTARPAKKRRLAKGKPAEAPAPKEVPWYLQPSEPEESADPAEASARQGASAAEGSAAPTGDRGDGSDSDSDGEGEGSGAAADSSDDDEDDDRPKEKRKKAVRKLRIHKFFSQRKVFFSGLA